MNRIDFLKKLIKYMLLLLLAVLAIAFGNKVVTGNNCSSCPGSRICKGESDCSKFLSDNYGREEK